MRFTLRRKGGSYPPVARVLGYDAHRGQAAVVLDGEHCGQSMEVLDLAELQLVGDDKAGTYGTAAEVEAFVRRRANVVVNGD